MQNRCGFLSMQVCSLRSVMTEVSVAHIKKGTSIHQGESKSHKLSIITILKGDKCRKRDFAGHLSQNTEGWYFPYSLVYYTITLAISAYQRDTLKLLKRTLFFLVFQVVQSLNYKFTAALQAEMKGAKSFNTNLEVPKENSLSAAKYLLAERVHTQVTGLQLPGPGRGAQVSLFHLHLLMAPEPWGHFYPELSEGCHFPPLLSMLHCFLMEFGSASPHPCLPHYTAELCSLSEDVSFSKG